MTLYALAKLLHVAVAVLGTGAIAGLAIVAHHARRAPATLTTGPLTALAIWSSISLAIMLVTGIWIDFEMHGAFHPALWFRASGIGVIAAGLVLGLVRRQLKLTRLGKVAPERAVVVIAGLAIIASALVLALVVLMERRPT